MSLLGLLSLSRSLFSLPLCLQGGWNLWLLIFRHGQATPILFLCCCEWNSMGCVNEVSRPVFFTKTRQKQNRRLKNPWRLLHANLIGPTFLRPVQIFSSQHESKILESNIYSTGITFFLTKVYKSLHHVYCRSALVLQKIALLFSKDQISSLMINTL